MKRLVMLVLIILLFPSVLASAAPTAQEEAEDLPLAYGDTVDGVLFPEEVTGYLFEGETGDRVTMSAVQTSGSADIRLLLYRPDGRLMFEDDNSNPVGTNNPYIPNFPLPEDGEYRLVVDRCKTCDTSTTALYTLSLSDGATAAATPTEVPSTPLPTHPPTAVPTTEPTMPATSNNPAIPPGANVLHYGQQAEKTLSANQVVEYYFEGIEGERITISATTTTGTADIAMELYGPDDNLLGEDDDSSLVGTLNPLIRSVPLPETGVYRIVIHHCSVCDSSITGRFSVNLNRALPDAPGLPQGDNVLTYGERIEDYLFPNAEVAYTFEGTIGDLVDIEAVRVSGGADLYLELYGVDGTLLREDDDSSRQGRYNPAIASYNLPATGTYRVVVRHCVLCTTNWSATFFLGLTGKQVPGMTFTPPTATPTTAPTATPTLRPTASPTPVNPGISGTTNTGSNVNVRSCAAATCTIVDTVASGESFDIMAIDNGWYSVTLADGTAGYINASLVTLEDGARPSAIPTVVSSSSP